MEKVYLFIFCLSFSAVRAQMKQSDRTAAIGIIGKEFVVLPNKPGYPYVSFNSNCMAQPSTTRKYDTTGVYFHNEYLLFRHPIAYKQGSEVLKLMSPDYVTVGEYLEFQQYVRDSTAREKIYHGMEGDAVASKFILHEATYFDPRKGKVVAFDPSDRDFNRNAHGPKPPLFPLNWGHHFSYSDNALKPFLVDMYYPQPERLTLARTFDERKLWYRYTDHYEQFQTIDWQEVLKRFPQRSSYGSYDKTRVDHCVLTLSDTYYWSSNSRFDRDELSVLGHLYNQKLKDEPVIGISGMQANAFCHWKQVQIQQALDRQKLPYKAVVTTPLFEDVPSVAAPEMTIPERNYTSQWKITVGEYRKFMAATQDSILRAALYYKIPSDQEAVKLLDFPTPFLDEGTTEMVKVLQFGEYRTRYDYNRYVFPLNYKYKIRPEAFGGLADSIQHSDAYLNPVFSYRYFDAAERSVQGEFMAMDRKDYHNYRDTLTLEHFTALAPDGEPIGKETIFETYNVLGQSYGVRSYDNLARLIHFKSVAIRPASAIDGADARSLIQEISYEQAVAFYYWKYPLQNADPSVSWQQFVLPSAEQFRQVQRGEQVIVPSRKIAYPTPVFRYVVHLYPN